jgi:hypothetical protein
MGQVLRVVKRRTEIADIEPAFKEVKLNHRPPMLTASEVA